ncbi:unnamed protein product [Urochloa humidicola]
MRHAANLPGGALHVLGPGAREQGPPARDGGRFHDAAAMDPVPLHALLPPPRGRGDRRRVLPVFRPNASGFSDMGRFWEAAHHRACRLIVHRSCPEAEPRLFPLIAEIFAKPVVPASLLLPEDVAAAGGGSHESFSDVARWLDEQPRRSVVYVALGSEAPVTADHVRELARGLELSGARFLWALRRPAAGHAAGELLPEGFERRVSGRGVVCTGWVPQVRVLAHAAVGAFLTHCGWGSTLEGLFRSGLPLVMLLFVADQGLIARAVTARGAGVEVARDDDDGMFRGEDVAAAVQRVMAVEEEEEGGEIARNATELRKVVGDRVGQEQYVDELVEYLQRYK